MAATGLTGAGTTTGMAPIGAGVGIHGTAQVGTLAGAGEAIHITAGVGITLITAGDGTTTIILHATGVITPIIPTPTTMVGVPMCTTAPADATPTGVRTLLRAHETTPTPIHQGLTRLGRVPAPVQKPPHHANTTTIATTLLRQEQAHLPVLTRQVIPAAPAAAAVAEVMVEVAVAAHVAAAADNKIKYLCFNIQKT